MGHLFIPIFHLAGYRWRPRFRLLASWRLWWSADRYEGDRTAYRAQVGPVLAVILADRGCVG